MVLVLTGAPGTGKSAAARALAARHERAAVVQADRFFDFIVSGFLDPSQPGSEEQNATVMRLVAGAAAGYAEAGYLTIVEGIFLPGFFLEPVTEALEASGQPVAHAMLRAPLDVCLARTGARRGEPWADPAVVERVWRAFEDAGPIVGRVVDTAVLTPEAVAERLA